jgi:hypothetical protein
MSGRWVRRILAPALLMAVLVFPGCGTVGAARIREYGPLMRNYQAMRKQCDPDGGDFAVKATGCPVCVY